MRSAKKTKDGKPLGRDHTVRNTAARQLARKRARLVALDLKVAPASKKLGQLIRTRHAEAECSCGSVLASNALLAWRASEVDRLMGWGAALLQGAAVNYQRKWPLEHATVEEAAETLHLAQKQLSRAWVLTRQLARDLRRTKRHDGSCKCLPRAFRQGHQTRLPDVDAQFERDYPELARIASGAQVQAVCIRHRGCDADANALADGNARG